MVFNLLHPELRKVLKKYGYIKPTKVQLASIPLILKGLNTLIIAPTGSGKTEAALLPVYSMILQNRNSGIQALYVTPLRALNRDIFRRMERIASEVGISIAIRHGDTTKSERRKISAKPPLILITTPETLQFLLVGKKLRLALRNLKWIIVDELHEVIDDKRGVQLSLALERLEEISRYRIQRIGLSATIGNVNLAKKILGGPQPVYDIIVEEAKRLDIKVLYPVPSNIDEELSNKTGLSPEAVARARYIIETLNRKRGILIFTNTRDLVERLASRIKLLDPSIPLFVHHGSLSREERISVETGFKEGKIKAIICTSSLELGVDIGHIDLVIQYMSPRQAIKLAQRVGRAGHRIGKVSRGIIVAIDEDDLMESLVLSRRATKGNYEAILIPDKPYDVLAHQIIGMLIEYKEISLYNLYRVISRSHYYRGLTLNELIELVTFLQELGYLILLDHKYLKGRKGIYKYYFEHASTIPDVKRFKVHDVVSNKYIGELDEEYVASFCEEDYDFILAGRVWKIEFIDEAAGVIEVFPSENPLAAVPSWIGEMVPVAFKTAREVGSLRRRLAEYILSSNERIKSNIIREYNLSEDLFKKLVNFIRKQINEGHPVPDDRTVYIEYSKDTAVIHGCFGSRINNTLALLIAEYLSKKRGLSVKYYSDPYRILIYSPRGLNINDILEVFSLKRNNIRDLILSGAKRSPAYRIKFIHVARRFGILEKEVSLKLLRKLIEIYDNTPLSKEALKEVLMSKFDLTGTLNIINLIKCGKINVTYRFIEKEFSPLANAIIKSYARYEHSYELVPTSLIVNIVRDRLLNKTIGILCMHCLNWSTSLKVKNLPDSIECPLCKSSVMTIVPREISKAISVLKKFKSRKKLSPEEKDLLNYLQKSALLYLSYGRKAALVLAGRGIGVATATKILSSARDERDLILKVIEAEKRFIKTRIFWDKKLD
ncbi:MAG: ATP-dependent helicase [Thermoprotei archaeon]|nr:MAG: ATP-dependent helicase [Thermoprotei archaeon]